jgi:hypothetical protein
MKTTGIFTTHEVTMPFKYGQPIKFIPFGDVHRDSDMHADEHWHEFLDYAKASLKKQPTIFLGMGDYTDGCSTSERAVLGGHTGLHDTTKRTMDNVYKGVVKTLSNELSFMRGNVIGLIGGNHYWDNGDGSTTDHLLASALQTKFLGVCSFIRINLQGPGKGVYTLDLFAHHGKGGGKLPGSTFNTIEAMLNSADADIYLMGHDHKKGCIPSSPRLRLIKNGGKLNVRERTPWLGRTGSFLKAYENGRVSYNVDAGRSPCSLGWIEFDITITRPNNGNESRPVEVRIRGTT